MQDAWCSVSDIIRAADVSLYSGSISEAQWQHAAAMGIKLAIVGLWTGTQHNDYAVPTLVNARRVGLTTAGYVLLNGMPGAQSIQICADLIGREMSSLNFLALDVELYGVTQAIVEDAAKAVSDLDMVSCIYTSASKWKELLGNPDFAAKAGLQLWSAHYGTPENLDEDPGYGGWSQALLLGKQYRGSNTRLGFNADLSVFRKEWVDVA